MTFSISQGPIVPIRGPIGSSDLITHGAESVAEVLGRALVRLEIDLDAGTLRTVSVGGGTATHELPESGGATMPLSAEQTAVLAEILRATTLVYTEDTALFSGNARVYFLGQGNLVNASVAGARTLNFNAPLDAQVLNTFLAIRPDDFLSEVDTARLAVRETQDDGTVAYYAVADMQRRENPNGRPVYILQPSRGFTLGSSFTVVNVANATESVAIPNLQLTLDNVPAELQQQLASVILQNPESPQDITHTERFVLDDWQAQVGDVPSNDLDGVILFSRQLSGDANTYQIAAISGAETGTFYGVVPFGTQMSVVGGADSVEAIPIGGPRHLTTYRFVFNTARLDASPRGFTGGIPPLTLWRSPSLRVPQAQVEGLAETLAGLGTGIQELVVVNFNFDEILGAEAYLSNSFAFPFLAPSANTFVELTGDNRTSSAQAVETQTNNQLRVLQNCTLSVNCNFTLDIQSSRTGDVGEVILTRLRGTEYTALSVQSLVNGIQSIWVSAPSVALQTDDRLMLFLTGTGTLSQAVRPQPLDSMHVIADAEGNSVNLTFLNKRLCLFFTAA